MGRMWIFPHGMYASSWFRSPSKLSHAFVGMEWLWRKGVTLVRNMSIFSVAGQNVPSKRLKWTPTKFSC